MAKSIQTTNFFTENEKKKLFFEYVFWVIWVLKHILNIDFFIIFFFRTIQKMAKSIQTTNFFTENKKKTYFLTMFFRLFGS